ncbi:hypothetical protein IYX23_05585 [Methylocystis sp. L43]|uniref:hypothetical protein n=1 Tax=unclassified Methylocystis TaxID=2625913 RepID=UPI0018C2268D|nr:MULTISPECIES: hypothetical protein [unclassified Methylocystis]MBG0797158.1 hypothetical protein [Methylocystis sp. L43]MBG0804971.1 hypothetical protein [Methylocystis sp. H15]
MTPPPYPLPLRMRKAAESFVVEDAGGVSLAYAYFEEDPSRQGLVNRLSGADAKALAQTIARALTARDGDAG